MKREVEIGAMHLQAKQCLGWLLPPEARREARKDPFLDAAEAANPADTLILDLWLQKL